MNSESKIIYFNGDVAEQVLELLQSIVDEDENTKMPVKFEELTAEPGELPRLMISPRESQGVAQRYISGETIEPFAFALHLRKAVRDEQDRLDAHQYLTSLTAKLLERCIALDGYVAYRKPGASGPVQLGATNAFEDWQVTVQLVYKQTIPKG